MLISDFYRIQKIDVAEGAITANIRLNPKHEVYKGHFPGQPVVPGVIQLQIVKEVLERFLDKELFMGKVSSAKYLRMISPETTGGLQITVQFKTSDEGEYKVSAQIGWDEHIFTKVRMTLTRYKNPEN